MNGAAGKLLEKFNKREAVIGIFGLGYVGLPLAVVFAKKNVRVIGFEKSGKKAEAVNEGRNYIGDIKPEDLTAVIKSGALTATTDFTRIRECDAVIICVPTPLDKFKKPEMKYIESACTDIGRYMKKGTFISLESTTYPTTTENFMRPIIEKESKMTLEEDFWLCFSAERVDPGNKNYHTENTPKVVGGLGETAQELGMAMYGIAIQTLYPVSSPRVSEMVKILENTYRLVNISLVNELALLCGQMNISIWEVIEAAKTKPYGFHAFYPGPGIGGHCIPLDPFYLDYIAKNYNFDLTMIHTAGLINNQMPHRMAVKISFALNRHKKPINGSKILFLGAAYKPDIDDERESPALMVIDEIAKKFADISYFDPFIPEVTTEHGRHYISIPALTKEALAGADCVVITTNHSAFDPDFIVEHAQLVVDLRNTVKKPSPKVFKL
ncbi:MAG: UDP-N-acetyl-D-glucosamine dehydrogenase [Spirochaetes bacterium GWF1_49_6]|nr:MAG: UDP-N-acetyl-D-glucosamine dehydrogenase [Spirochaetes bacterium GWF1_49_6]